MQALFNYLGQFKQAAGVSIELQPDGTGLFYLVELKVEKKKLSIIQKKTSTDVETLLNGVEKNIPIAVCIDGKGILHKEVTTFQFQSPEEIVESVLPNAKAASFHLQVVERVNGSIVSIGRKEAVDLWLTKIAELGFSVAELCLGKFCLAGAGPVLELKGKTLPYASASLSFDEEGSILRSEPATGSSTTPARYASIAWQLQIEELPAFAMAFQVVMPDLYQGQVFQVSPELDNKEDRRQELIFKKGIRLAAICIGLILFVNALLFTQYYFKVEELTAQQSNSLYVLQQVDTLQKELNNKKQYVEQAGWLSDQNYASLADAIAATVPNAASLSEMSMNPKEQNQAGGSDKFVFKRGQIYISGYCPDPVVLNEWVKRLLAIEGIASAKIIRYQLEDMNGKGLFELAIEANV